MRWARIGVVWWCLAVAGCVASGSTSAGFKDASLKTGYLVERYGQIVGTSQQSYLSYLKARLQRVVELSDFELPAGQHYPLQLVLLNSSKPLAYSPGAGFVVLSKGIVRTLQNEAQFAFVIAHEMSHYLLNHELESERVGIYSHEANIRRQELEADALALKIITRAGYEQTQSLSAIRSVYAAAAGYLDESEESYTRSEREQALVAALRTKSSSHPALVSTRDFFIFKNSLS